MYLRVLSLIIRAKATAWRDNLYFDYKTNAQLSNVTFRMQNSWAMISNTKRGRKWKMSLLEDGRLKYAVSNKFVPFDYEV